MFFEMKDERNLSMVKSHRASNADFDNTLTHKVVPSSDLKSNLEVFTTAV